MGERGQFGVAFQHAPPHVMSVEGAIEPHAASTDPATEAWISSAVPGLINHEEAIPC
jgi:hypothetical protein